MAFSDVRYPSGLRLVPLLVGDLIHFGSARSPLLHIHTKATLPVPLVLSLDFEPVWSQEQLLPSKLKAPLGMHPRPPLP